MRKLRIMEHISLDGVIQQSEDENNFAFSEWTAPYRTQAGREEVTAAQGEHFDLLLAAALTIYGQATGRRHPRGR